MLLATSTEWSLAATLEAKSPAGKLSNAFSSFSQGLRGYNSYQERFDGELQEDVSLTFSETAAINARVTPWAWWRLPEAIGAAPRSSLAQFELKEGWVERVGSTFDLRVGNQIVTWGAADQINPTDVWNPRDLYDPLQSTKLPLFMVKAKIHPPETESLALELIVSPFFRETRLPVAFTDTATEINLTDSRWLISVPSTVDAGGGLVAPLHYVITPATYPKTWQAGGRLQLLRLGGWDFSGSYYNGVESTPRFAITRKGSASSAALPITLTLNPSFHRQEVIGADGAGSISLFSHEIGTRFEVAYYHRDNSRAQSAPPEFQADLTKDDYIHGVVGLDYTFPKKLLGTVLYANAMYVKYKRVQGKESQTGRAVITGLPNTQPWDSDFVLYLEDRIGSAFKLTANGIYSTEHGDAYASPGALYNWTDNFKTQLSADFFVGSVGGFFGQFKDNRRVNLVASYSF
ncbi:MAG: hypothetical protein HY075_10495 [Deltaproteobacteria bacterium]|nr:hypothetical protein [Deltaproteobacteria bacterium]